MNPGTSPLAPGAGLPRWPGTLAALLVAGLCLGTLAPLALRAGGAAGGGPDAGLGPADWAALRFTVLQAALSAGASVLLAVPVARALARRAFPGRALLVTLMGAPFVLPTVVAVLGILAAFGRRGLVAGALDALGLPVPSIYGLGGVVLAHVVLNLPLATRLLLQGWLSIPAERFRLAASLGAPVGPLLERPMLRAVLPGAFAAIFALCLSSFAVALTLGGGPRATTVELAIYQAVRFEADFAAAAALALMQYALCGAAALAALFLARGLHLGGGLGRVVERWDARGPRALAADALAVGAAALLCLLPLAAVAARGVSGLSDLPPGTGAAAGRSLAVALAAAALACLLGFLLALRGGALAEAAGALPLAASPVAFGAGLLVLLRPFAAPAGAALPAAALADALLALPFALRVLAPAVARVEARHGRLASSLGVAGRARLLVLHLPLLRPAFGFAAGLAAALSTGSLGVVALFAGEGGETLPLLLARLMGSYRMDAAAGVALLLLVQALLLFWLFDRGGRLGARA